MDPNTGKLYEVDEVEAKKRGLVPVRRDLTKIEHMRMQIALYAPCGCGSGKKFKFCCHRDPIKEAVKTALGDPPQSQTGEV